MARTIDSDRKHLTSVLRAAAEHNGTALVEIYQNCNIFNDGAFDPLKDSETRDDVTIRLEHGAPITFGVNGEHAVVRDGFGHLTTAETTSLPAGFDPVVHDAHDPDPTQAFALSRLSNPETLANTPIGDLPRRGPAHLRRRGGPATRYRGAPAGARRSRRSAGRPGYLDRRTSIVATAESNEGTTHG